MWKPGQVITGAASGIGRATVTAALARGYRVVAADLDQEGLQREFAGDPAVRTVQCDVTDRVSVEAAFDAVKGEPALVVNSAGIPDRTLLTDISDETWSGARRQPRWHDACRSRSTEADDRRPCRQRRLDRRPPLDSPGGRHTAHRRRP